MADTRAAKIPSPAHRETALCRVLPFVKKTAGCNAEWDAAVHQLHRLGVCTSCPGLPSLPTCLLACLLACRTGPGSHSASQGATKCLAQSPQNL